MLWKNENIFVDDDQSVNADTQQKKDILDIIEFCSSFQDIIKKLEAKNLIWHFIGPLCKDKDIRIQINLKWEIDFQKFEQLTNKIHKELTKFLQDQNFLVYQTKNNTFKIRFEIKSPEQKPIEISNILKASNEGKIYDIYLGKGSQITACKKNGNERHYDFTGSNSCEMTINWQAKDSKGNSIDCSITVEVGPGDISNIKAVKFGQSEEKSDHSKMIDLIRTNIKLVNSHKEIYLNGSNLSEALEAYLTRSQGISSPGESMSSQTEASLTPSSGISSLSLPSSSSRRSSISSSGNECDGESDQYSFEGEGEKHEQGKQKPEDRIKQLEEENAHFKREFEKLNEKLKKQQADTQQKLEETEAKLRVANKQVREVEELNKSIKQLKQWLIDMQQKLDQETKDLAAAEQEKQNLARDLESKNEEIDKLKKQQADAQQKLNDTLEKFSTKDSKIEELKNRINALKREKEELHIENAQLNEEVELLRKQKFDAEKAKNEAEQGKQDLEEKLDQKEQEIKSLQTKIQELESARENDRTSNSALESQVTTLQEAKKKLNQQLIEQKKQNSTLQEDLEHSLETQKGYERTASEIRGKLSRVAQEKGVLTAKLEEKQKLYEESQNEVAKSYDKIKNLTESLNQESKRNKELQEQNDFIKRNNQYSEDKCKKLALENLRLKKNVSSLNDQLLSSGRDVDFTSLVSSIADIIGLIRSSMNTENQIIIHKNTVQDFVKRLDQVIEDLGISQEEFFNALTEKEPSTQSTCEESSTDGELNYKKDHSPSIPATDDQPSSGISTDYSSEFEGIGEDYIQLFSRLKPPIRSTLKKSRLASSAQKSSDPPSSTDQEKIIKVEVSPKTKLSDTTSTLNDPERSRN